ncbi:MAG: shikimate kinase [Ignavibacteriales bacterium]|nr:MAG: shikimate kinase [Ignavibacteriaceae bacterium]MBW7873609.1 shikimate kinase [Ignavibacteria bacterium]MCZ2143839.1 shikimate kinase [Ignavibacteriales bacterium]OQY75755.1 MAG: hypothetical protein B6D45_05220 [Ignavibacteriales bacterium UTCHB3]MBV6445890.1 Shikimate kinase [Ignavibacteriaceae bacterium]
MQHKRIYLTGFMGTGKTTLGRVVANCLGWEFYDTDKEIEKDTQAPVATFVLKNGEEAFRKLEDAKLLELSVVEGAVISLGGGTLMNPKNIEICKSSGLLVYLKSNLSVIYNRVKKRTTRPLFKSEADPEMSREEAMKKLKLLFEQRREGYETADLTVEIETDNFGMSIDKIVNVIRSGRPEKKTWS